LLKTYERLASYKDYTTNAFKLSFGVDESRSFYPRQLKSRWQKNAIFQ